MRLPPPLRIALTYALVAGIWIFASDRLLGLLVRDPDLFVQLATFKGWVFVILTALMLYGLVKQATDAKGKESSPALLTRLDSSLRPIRWVWPLTAFALLATCILAIALLVMHFLKGTITREEQGKLAILAEHKALSHDAWLGMGITHVESAASNPLVTQTVEACLKTPTPQLQTRLREQLGSLLLTGRFRFVGLRDAKGRMQSWAGEKQLLDETGRRALTTGQTQVRSGIDPEGNAFVHVFAALRIKERGEPRIAGCIEVDLDPQRTLFPFLKTAPNLSAPEGILILTPQGDVINTSKTKKGPGFDGQFRTNLRRDTGDSFIHDKKMLGAVAWAKNLPWGILVAEDPNVTFKASQRLFVYVGLLGAVFLAVGGALISFWLRLQRTIYQQSVARQALERQILEQRLDYLSRFANDIVLLLDSNGRILDANDRACNAYGYTKEEMLSLTIKEIRPPETLGLFPEQWSQTHQEGAIVFETLHLRRDGSTFPVEVSSRKVEQGERPLVQSIIRDITDRKRAEEELRRVNRLQSLILDNSAMGIALTRHSLLEWVNPRMAHMFGGPVERMHGKPFRELCPPEHPYEAGRTALYAALRAGKWYEVEHQFVRLDGSFFWGRAIAKAVDQDHPEEAAIWIFEDITRRKESEEALFQAQKLESLGVLAGGIAHDFNNLLTAILGNLNLAQIKLDPAHPAQGFLGNVERTIHKAADLTRQMLAYSGRGRFVVEPNDFNRIVEDMTHLLDVSIPKKVTLVKNLAPALQAVLSDRAQLQQVVMNLMTNAADAIGEGSGTITLTTRMAAVQANMISSALPGKQLPAGDYVVLEVQDTGCGMAPEVQARIFDPFFSTKLTGRGLGLSALQGILRGHQAGMQIESQPGRGTCFRLFFPGTSRQKITETHSTPSLSPMAARVLLVEDEATIRQTTASALGMLDMTVISATDGEEALERFQAGAFDIVILDLTMPRMDGREAFRRLRAIQPDLRVVICSGYSEDGTILDEAGQGPAAFLPKPYTFKELKKLLALVLGRTGS